LAFWEILRSLYSLHTTNSSRPASPHLPRYTFSLDRVSPHLGARRPRSTANFILDLEVSLMKLYVVQLLFFAVVLTASATRAQTPEELEDMTPKQRVARLEMAHDELATLEKETVRAFQQRSVTFFRRVYSDDFLGVGPSGTLMDKNSFLSSVQTSSTLYSSFVVSDIRVRIYKEVAVVTSTWNAIAVHEGHSVGQQFRVTHVYVYGQHGWQAICSQATLLPG
jgi:hypothetical protein